MDVDNAARLLGEQSMSHPRPEIPCREAWPYETPRTAQLLADGGRDAGWTVRVTFARGTAIDRRGEPAKVVDSIAVRLQRGTQRALGLWIDERFSNGWTWCGHGLPVPISARDLAKHVREVA